MNIEFNRKQRIAIFVLVLVAIILFVASVGYSIGVNKTTAELTKSCDERVRGVQFDKAAAAVKLAAAEAETKTTQAAWDQAVVRLHADNAALLLELDADGDGVHIPTDVCPNSVPAAGEAKYVIPTNGCLENEVVTYGGCASTAFPPDKDTGGKGKLWFLGCKLAEDPKFVYQCAYELNPDRSYKYLGDCHGFDQTVGP